jgi:predicted DNA-binding protein (UPF0251 family)
VGWLLNGAYWRALNLYASEQRKPRETSLEAVFHLADKSTPSPEQQALESERKQRLQKALSHLPQKECELLSLIYYEGLSIRAAGRKLGWGKSAADRHHNAAMEKMLAIVGERKFLSPAILGPLAWAVLNAQARGPLRAAWNAALGPLREAMALGADAAHAGAHRLAEPMSRLSPFTESGNAAAAGGGGRVLGYCGVAAGAVVCGLLGSGAIGPGVSALPADAPETAKPRAMRHRLTASPAPIAAPKLSTPELPLPQPSAHPEAPPQTEPVQPTRRRARNPLYRAPVASGQQSASEFGDNNFVPGATPESAQPSEAPAESSQPSTPPSGSKPSGSSAASEFGL